MYAMYSTATLRCSTNHQQTPSRADLKAEAVKVAATVANARPPDAANPQRRYRSNLHQRVRYCTIATARRSKCDPPEPAHFRLHAHYAANLLGDAEVLFDCGDAFKRV